MAGLCACYHRPGRELLKDLHGDPSLGPVTALLLADYGASQLNPPEWIAKLRPQVVLLSVDANDRQNQPDAATLQTLEGYSLLRTDLNGWIELSTDGEQMWVEVEKEMQAQDDKLGL